MLLFKFHSALIDDDLVYISRKKTKEQKRNDKPEKIVDLSIVASNNNEQVLHN